MNLWNYLGPFQCHNFFDLSDIFFLLNDVFTRSLRSVFVGILVRLNDIFSHKKPIRAGQSWNRDIGAMTVEDNNENVSKSTTG